MGVGGEQLGLKKVVDGPERMAVSIRLLNFYPEGRQGGHTLDRIICMTGAFSRGPGEDTMDHSQCYKRGLSDEDEYG
jgi:hypothetical protein